MCYYYYHYYAEDDAADAEAEHLFGGVDDDGFVWLLVYSAAYPLMHAHSAGVKAAPADLARPTVIRNEEDHGRGAASAAAGATAAHAIIAQGVENCCRQSEGNENFDARKGGHGGRGGGGVSLSGARQGQGSVIPCSRVSIACSLRACDRSSSPCVVLWI